jgi:hypothetical protein
MERMPPDYLPVSIGRGQGVKQEAVSDFMKRYVNFRNEVTGE